jgi:hypothetical protein
MVICTALAADTPGAGPYRGLMLRILLLIAGAIVAVLVVVAIVHALLWLATLALIIFAIGLLFGVFRIGRRSGRRSR